MARSTQLVVTAPLVIAKNDEGGDVYVYRGAPVPAGQSEDWLERHKRDGMIGEPKAKDRAPATDDGSSSPSGNFDAAAFVGRNADEVRKDAGSLSDDQRAAALAAEEAGDKRTTVLQALRGE